MPSQERAGVLLPYPPLELRLAQVADEVTDGERDEHQRNRDQTERQVPEEQRRDGDGQQSDRHADGEAFPGLAGADRADPVHLVVLSCELLKRLSAHEGADVERTNRDDHLQTAQRSAGLKVERQVGEHHQSVEQNGAGDDQLPFQLPRLVPQLDEVETTDFVATDDGDETQPDQYGPDRDQHRQIDGEHDPGDESPVFEHSLLVRLDVLHSSRLLGVWER